MKVLSLALLTCFSLTALASDPDLQATFKRHRALLHEENRKWSLQKEECRKQYPQFYQASHADYDKHFQCTEAIQDARQAFDNKLSDEICKLHNVCNRSPASSGN